MGKFEYTCRVKRARENLKGESRPRQWRFHGRISAIVNGEFVSVAHDFLTVWGIERDRKPRYVNVADIRWIGTENRARVHARILRYRMHINAYISTSRDICVLCVTVQVFMHAACSCVQLNIGSNVHTLDTERGSGEIDFRYRHVLPDSHTTE